MTTTPTHAAGWTLRRVFADLFPTRRPVRVPADLLSGREAVARALFAEQCQHSLLDLADYDASPMLQGAWGAEADRRIAHAQSQDRHVAAFHGIKDADWIHLPSLAKADHREAFWKAKGM
jgi:hypothetical protein